MPYDTDHHSSCHATRRQQLMEHMRANGGGLAIIANAPEVIRNNDVEYPYRHDSYFYYLSGFSEPDAVMVLVAKSSYTQAILFCRDKDSEHEIWHGFRHGPEGACSHFGFDAAYSINDLDAHLPALLMKTSTLYYSLGRYPQLDARVQSWLQQLRKQARNGIKAPVTIQDVQAIVSQMRLIKDSVEIATMRKAAAISASAHQRAMRFTRPGQTEYQIEAELLHEFHRHGAAAPAYPSIVAAGANACVLHHNPGSKIVNDGDLILIDAGCEYQSYASDISRTYPVSGKFTVAQQALYEIVLAAQEAAIAVARPGARFMDTHVAAVGVLAQGMLDTGLLNSQQQGSVDDVIANGSYKQFFMCRTSHWIGLDVHDVGDYHDAVGEKGGQHTQPWCILHPGMCLTIEPGLYIRPAAGVPEQYWNSGIRIEDDVLITGTGCEILSHAVPKTVGDIERLMAC